MLGQVRKAVPEESRAQRIGMGLWLKSLREAQGLSQRDLANILSLEYYTFISQLENGRGKIPAHRYREWADALGTPHREFVMTLMSFHDPITYDILFKDGAS